MGLEASEGGQPGRRGPRLRNGPLRDSWPPSQRPRSVGPVKDPGADGQRRTALRRNGSRRSPLRPVFIEEFFSFSLIAMDPRTMTLKPTAKWLIDRAGDAVIRDGANM